MLVLRRDGLASIPTKCGRRNKIPSYGIKRHVIVRCELFKVMIEDSLIPIVLVCSIKTYKILVQSSPFCLVLCAHQLPLTTALILLDQLYTFLGCRGTPLPLQIMNI